MIIYVTDRVSPLGVIWKSIDGEEWKHRPKLFQTFKLHDFDAIGGVVKITILGRTSIHVIYVD